MVISLRAWVLGWGGLLVMAGAVLMVAPDRGARLLKQFPRNRASAWLLSGAALAWTAWIVRETAHGRFSFLHAWGIPLGFLLWITANRWLDELLAPRALGGLLLLAADPLLFSVRMHPSGWSRVPAAWAYLTVAAGIALLLSPHGFRRAWALVFDPPARLRRTGAGIIGFGAFLALLGFLVLG